MEAPIVYEVDRARDGGSFSSRRVVAIQHGRPISESGRVFSRLRSMGLEHQAQYAGRARCLPIAHDILDAESELVQKMPEKMRRHMADQTSLRASTCGARAAIPGMRDEKCLATSR